MARPNGEVATCYQSHFSFEPAVAAIGLIVIGSGLHSTRIAGRRFGAAWGRADWKSVIGHGSLHA